MVLGLCFCAAITPRTATEVDEKPINQAVQTPSAEAAGIPLASRSVTHGIDSPITPHSCPPKVRCLPTMATSKLVVPKARQPSRPQRTAPEPSQKAARPEPIIKARSTHKRRLVMGPDF